MTERKFGSTLQTLDRLRKNGNLAALSRNPRTAEHTQPAFMRLAAIAPDPDQPRRHFDPDQLASLAESIKEQGVLQAITVQPPNAEGMHLIIMGERRYRAAMLAEVDAIPVVIRSMTDELRMAQLTENVQRAELTTLEIGEAVAAMRAAGRSRAEIGKALGWGEGEVSRFAAIPQMPDPIRRAAAEGAPIRALSDLHALWKQDEARVGSYLAATPAAEITRVTVNQLRDQIGPRPQAQLPVEREPTPEIDAVSSEIHPAVLSNGDPVPPRDPMEMVVTPLRAAPPSAPKSGSAPLLTVRCGDREGRAVLDQTASNSTRILVQFNTAAAPEEVALADLVMVELRQA